MVEHIQNIISKQLFSLQNKTYLYITKLKDKKIYKTTGKKIIKKRLAKLVVQIVKLRQTD